MNKTRALLFGLVLLGSFFEVPTALACVGCSGSPPTVSCTDAGYPDCTVTPSQSTATAPGYNGYVFDYIAFVGKGNRTDCSGTNCAPTVVYWYIYCSGTSNEALVISNICCIMVS